MVGVGSRETATTRLVRKPIHATSRDVRRNNDRNLTTCESKVDSAEQPDQYCSLEQPTPCLEQSDSWTRDLPPPCKYGLRRSQRQTRVSPTLLPEHKRLSHFGSRFCWMVSRVMQSRVLLSQPSEHVDVCGLPSVFVGAVGSFFGGAEWQWLPAGSVVRWMVMVLHPSCDRVVLGASDDELFDECAFGCAEGKRTEVAGSKVAGPFGEAKRRAYCRCASFRGDEKGLECNSALSSKLRMRLNLLRRPSRR